MPVSHIHTSCACWLAEKSPLLPMLHRRHRYWHGNEGHADGVELEALESHFTTLFTSLSSASGSVMPTAAALAGLAL